MKKILSLFVLMVSLLTVSAQTVKLTFTGRDENNNYCQLNRVVITNLTQSWQETIYWPDTILMMQAGTGIEDYVAEKAFALSQNNPNPFNAITYATVQTSDAGEVVMELSDVNGRIVETWRAASMQSGIHQFQINVSAAGIYFLNARHNGQTSSVKMVNTGSGSANKIEYQGFVNTLL